MNKSNLPSDLPPNLPPNVRIVTLDELKRLATRLQKVTNFNFTGAVVCMLAGIYFAQAGSELLPKVFVAIMAMTLVMTILSYRASNRVSKVIEVVTHKKPKL